MLDPIEDIKVVNLDGQSYQVSELSQAIQRMVKVYNEWSHKEMEARTNLIMIQSAKNDLSRQIINQFQTEQMQQQMVNLADQITDSVTSVSPEQSEEGC